MIRPGLPFRPALLLMPCLLVGCASPSDVREATAIGAVQGRAERSALVGQDVTVRGVVTAKLDGGWFVQDAGDGDDATSDAIFVQDAASPVRPGDAVLVHGTLAELGVGRATRTALVRARVERIGEGEAMATPLAKAPTDWERLGGIRVRLDEPVLPAGSGDLTKLERILASLKVRPWHPEERHVTDSDGYRAEVPRSTESA